ncbi:CYTH domain-containing protein [Marilutibacter aestuarii]|uniref:CYTH domain-containing protein n=1 Tax=Marilutibacter aestuarii TaxID=1706195 RepID=A0A508A8T4_9GAMM|nr:CYTH domain-containing protein [Lysobacter aestuarii]TQD45071.1 CYTH domain-containing protein [Lysobacter aestuarii]
MGIEIERKFLVRGDAWRTQAHQVETMAQGYLNDLAAMASVDGADAAMKASVRVRIAGDAAFLNIKSRELGHTRQEFDYAIPVADARDLLALCVGGRIEKRRHRIAAGTREWEVDEFLGENAGLVVAEIELDDADEAFDRPDWLGEEVTHAVRYYNLALASRPYSQWTADERAGTAP